VTVQGWPFIHNKKLNPT